MTIYEAQEIVFVGAAGSVADLLPGEEVDFGRVADFFGRAKQDVEAEWQAMVGNVQQLLARLTTITGTFALDAVEVELGFSAEGHLGFIAKAGATASVRLKFSRKDAPPAT
jgi:hypothetical protein